MHGNLTQREVAALGETLNLADGHAFRAWTDQENALVDRLPSLFRQDDRLRLNDITETYFETFFGLSGQTLDRQAGARFPCFTASSGIELIANHLRLAGKSVTLIEPCFDNLKDILRRHQVPLTPLPDDVLQGDAQALEERLDSIDTDVLFLVSPNNPTGTTVSEATLIQILNFCSRRGVMLILDTCFRFYQPDADVYDQYKLLIDADIDWIVIEDTGKTWPTLEIKAPFLSVSRRLAADIDHINSDFLLHVSPFALRLLTGFLELSGADDRDAVRGLVRHNRGLLREALASTFLTPVEQPFMSVSWLRIDPELRGELTGQDVTQDLAQQGIHVLPGNDFFWSDERLGDPYVRVALVRDTSTFTQAADVIRHVCARDQRIRQRSA
ncbi:pyridoxal phosphate-dependent aminotransferase [Kineosporia sp. NBRC 101731]|uniref:pyridoxal phosphate-dependent aminotransferase n=1 Tax=Kineosporia sp. NBRC 101731 TaxID=3032199 RepID=UPI0024A08FCB|nr:pyridoxal phosphate-dependent aminotransferase [Kineosporia sp. NBRC 101731]GLY33454.1 hypothetical protein Kisp02_68190 [Kineosporia sp. NBRC 101731]